METRVRNCDRGDRRACLVGCSALVTRVTCYPHTGTYLVFTRRTFGKWVESDMDEF
jgi:hypothetical protein